MTFSALLEILKTRFWLILLIPLGAAGTAFMLGQSQTTTYITHATILLDYRKPLEGDLAGELLPVGMQPSYVTTQTEIIKSRPVADQVVTILELMKSPLWIERYAATGGAPDDFRNWLTDTLMAQLQVTVGTETRLIDLWYKDADPNTAAQIANAFVDAYREIMLQLAGAPAFATAKSADKLLTKLREELEQAENRVSSYQARMGIMATDERVDVETEHLNELMREKLATEASLRAAESRLTSTTPADGKGASLETTSELLSNELIKSLNIDLARKEGEFADLATSLGERHPTMQKLSAEIENLRKNLASESGKIAAATRSDADRARRLAEAARIAEDDQRKRVIELKHVRDGLQPLLRELESARASYDRALQVYSEYAMHGELGQTNVSVLSPAQVPQSAPPSNLARNVIGAFVGGMVFALGLTLLWELADRRVRGKEGIAGFGDVGYLGALPKA